MNQLKTIVGALLLGLFSPAAFSSAAICPDNITYYDTVNPGTCPVNTTSLSVLDITQTTVNISATADAQAAGSTGYHWTSASQFPAGCTSLHYAYADLSSGVTATRQAAIKARQKCMNWKTMVAGTGAVSYGSAAISVAGIYTVPITGLTESTTYYTQHFVMGGVGGAGKVGVLNTQQFATNASGATPGDTYVTDAGAAPRFIGTGGNDASDGLTHATRWLTLPKVTCGMPAGTNIGLFNTSTFTTSASQLDICYNSSSTDWAIVGSYKLNGSSVPIWTVDGIRGKTETDQKAKILGNLTQACLDARNCAFTAATFIANGQSSLYDPPMSVTGNYVEVRNIDFDMQPGYAVIVSGEGNTSAADTGPGSTHHVILDGIDAENVGGGPYVFVEGFKDGVFRNGTATTWGVCWQLKALGNSAANSNYLCDGSAVPSVGGLVRSYNGRLLVENNDFVGGIGEGGFDCGGTSSHLISRGNRLYGAQSAGLYVDGCSSVVSEANILIGGQDYGIQGAGTTLPGSGLSGEISVTIESWQGANSNNANNYLARNNLQVRTGYCFAMSIQEPAATTYARTVGMRVHGNTCIASTFGDFQQWTPIVSNDVQVLDIKSNAFWNEDVNYWALSVYNAIAGNHSYAARSSNGGTSASTGNLGLVTNTYSTWAGYKGPSSWPTFALARPDVGSALNDTGVSSEAVIFTWAEFGFAATEMADFKSGAILSTHWVKERYYDALNNVVGATPPKGAVCAAAGC